MGVLPQIFHGDRTKADNFIDEVKAYLHLNTDITVYNSPFKKGPLHPHLDKRRKCSPMGQRYGQLAQQACPPQR